MRSCHLAPDGFLGDTPVCSKMELRHLKTFLVVAETLNISAAARRLHVTQPALSRHIHLLEHQVGHPLFVRHRSGLRLTATGLTLRDYGLKAVEAAENALQHARGAGSKEGTVVRFGYYGISVWENILAPAIEEFVRQHPQVTLNMVEESSVHLAADLQAGQLDVALLGEGDYRALPGVVTEVACTIPSVAVVAPDHRLAGKRSVSLADLRDEEIIGFKHQDAPGKYRPFLEACRAEGFTPRVSQVASIFPELCVAVRKRQGVAILSAFARAVSHPGVVFLRLCSPGVPVSLYTAHAARASAAALDLARILAAQAQLAARAALDTK